MRSRFALPLGALLAAGIAALAFVLGSPVGGGWLMAFALVGMVPVGSLALLLVHGISGGRWGEDLAPALVPAARCLPILLLLALPILIWRPFIYRWHELGLEADVVRLYLNPLFFDARTLLALVLWSGLAWIEAWRRPLFSALGLATHLVLTTLIPADWILTLPPGSTSAGFGLGFGIEQMLTALGFAAVLAPQGSDPRANRDLSGMIVSALLGTIYFAYMQYLIIWYGNIPEKVHWYALRSGSGWSALALAAFFLGAVLPFLAILNPFIRRNPAALRVVGALVLSGAALHIAWLTAPAFDIAALLPAALAAPAMVLLMAGAATSFRQGIAYGR